LFAIRYGTEVTVATPHTVAESGLALAQAYNEAVMAHTSRHSHSSAGGTAQSAGGPRLSQRRGPVVTA